MTSAPWFKSLATIGITVTASLAPVYGKDHWYIILAAVTGAIALAAQSVVKSGS